MNLGKAYHLLFNAKFAIVSAFFNGSIVAAMHYSEGWSLMSFAALSQAFSSFLSTGFTARLVQHFSPVKNPWKSYLLGSFVPALATLLCSLFFHWCNNTSNILLTIIPPVTISFSTSFMTNFMTKRWKFFRPKNYPIK